MEFNLKNAKEVYSRYHSLNLNRFVSDKQIKEERDKKLNAFGIIFCLSIINLLLGIFFKDRDIFYLSVSLIICFGICFLLTKIVKINIIADIVAAISYCSIVTYYLLISSSYNFSILWILIAPIIVFSIMRTHVAIISNLYVLLFIGIMFYSPLNARYIGFYPLSFLYYFPAVYLIELLISFYIYIKNDVNEKQSRINTYIDELTNLGNRSYYNHVVKYMQEQGLTKQRTKVVSLDVNGLKEVNDELGHSYGDILLKGAADAINSAFNNAELIARIGGDEFVVITNENDDEFDKSLKLLDSNCNNFKNESIKKLSISKGYAKSKEHPYVNPEKLYKIADEMMYKDKTNYYMRNNIERRKKMED